MDFLVSLLSNPSMLLGAFAFIGLVSQKKNGTEVLTGTFKTVIGFMVFSVGATTITGSLQNFNVLFQTGFNITGVVASPEAATALAQGAYGFVVSSTLILGFLMNLVFARITPLKNILFHGGHSLFFACVLALILKSYEFSDSMAIVIGGTLLGFCSAALPQLCQPFMRKITGGDDVAIGHFNMIGYAASGYIGNLFGKYKAQSTEDINFPKWLSFFRDFLMGVSTIMLILFYIATLAAGSEATGELSGSIHWLVYPLLQAFTFAAGMSILMTGVRMFLAELTAAFVSISEKFIPNSRPALDVPTIFPFAPTAVLVGFLSSYAAGLLAIVIMATFSFPVIIIPAAHICFFSGGTAGVFGNSTGGWRGAVAGSFFVGLLLAFLPAILYPLYADMGIEGSTFPNVDHNIIGILLDQFLNIFR
ncbi:PTS ascorbate transporter subunit IIC [Marinilactibacillus kalidii]|uniref:PTS ascorbate transporter subunit IIC n=1 Tax=Marinilactibacillus kalidii TaxID=2820274 RepID=UPI001ABE566B|nr:PTS ascorbate transporter subunit IIC [Marinilactibacillus kalidii]